MSLKVKPDNIRAVIFDIDGVLTNGLIGYGTERELKFFHVRDGHGIKLAKRAGLKVGALSGRSAEANRIRANELEFDFIYEGRRNKGEAFEVLLSENSLEASECLYIGDDVVDIPVMKAAGLSAAVADAAREVFEYCDFRSKLPGGQGAVREIIEWLLKEQGKWEKLMEKYTG